MRIGVLIAIAVIAFLVALLIFGRELRFRIRERQWADIAVGGVMIILVTLVIFAAVRFILLMTGALDALGEWSRSW